MNQTQKNYFEYVEMQVENCKRNVEQAKESLARELEEYAQKLRQDRFYSTDPGNLHNRVDNYTQIVERLRVAETLLDGLKNFENFGEEDQPE